MLGYPAFSRRQSPLGGVGVALLVSAAISSRVGATIGKTGGRPVLAVDALLLALGLANLGLATSLPVFLLG